MQVETACWENSPQIAQFMQDHNFSSYDDVYMYFVTIAHSLARSVGRTPVAWEEVFNHFGSKLDKVCAGASSGGG